ncbi:MAG TPA: hypothetical protein VFT72_17620 [Opitutaceae bacterium]|nr:hypothetical protein [Opitutaceae bacterium]
MDNTSGESISVSLRMSKAMALARAGRLSEAQKVVADERTIPDDMLALHALAALVTSEGDYLRALKLWELVLQRDPAHAEAKRMIAAIELWIMRPSWYRYLPWLGAAAALLVIALVFVVATGGPARSLPADKPAITNSSEVSPVQRTPGNLPAGINAVGPSEPQYQTPTPTPLPPVTFNLNTGAAKKRR